MTRSSSTRCEFCSRPAAGEVEIQPATYHYPGGKKTFKKPAVKARVCFYHREAVRRGRGWQERQEQAREVERAALKDATVAAQLFDPAITDRRSRPRRRRRDPGR